nr:uncharacterized protein LOC117988518 [Maniola hyperantus]
MRWTSLMNENVMRAYYRATGGETGRTGYRAAMYREFLLLEPNLTVTEQNLADRARYIQRSNIFNAAELERLRREAVPEVSAPVTEQIDSQAVPVPEETNTISQDLPVEEDTEGTVSLDIERMRGILEEAISEIRSAPLENRPRLSRLTLNVATRDVIEAINKMLPQHLESSTGLGDTASILFGAALAVHRFIGAKTPGPERAAAARRSAEPAWKKRIERRITLARVLIGRLQSFSREVEHEEGPWIAAVEEACASIEPMNPVAISAEDVAGAVRRAPNWKSPGPDGLHHYWLKGFSVCHATLARQFQEALEQRALPSLFTTGITHLAPKSTDTTDPAKYRPITCLTTIYKTLTSVLSLKISRHVDENNIISGAQNGCRGGSRGTKELLLIDSVAGQLVKRNRRNFSAAWIDYRKAFDSVPHSWLLRVLELYKVDGTVRDFLGACMGQWSTILCLHGERLAAADDRIRIGRGIFQGDCLSPLWFCLSLNPLSTLLEGSGTGFQFRRGGTKVPHLLYMDDLKLLAPNATRLQELLNVTTDFSNSIRMELGLDKCAVMHVERGQVTHLAEVSLEPSTIRTLSEAESYRYLGMSQSLGVKETDVKHGNVGASTIVCHGAVVTFWETVTLRKKLLKGIESELVLLGNADIRMAVISALIHPSNSFRRWDFGLTSGWSRGSNLSTNYYMNLERRQLAPAQAGTRFTSR